MHAILKCARRALVISATALALTGTASATNYTYRISTPGVRAIEAALPAPAAQPLLLTLSSFDLPDATRATPFSYDFSQLLSITGDNQPVKSQVSWTTSGTLPAGLALSSAGTVSGTPTTIGNSTFQVIAAYTDKTGQQVYTINVNGQALDVVQVSGGYAHTCVLTAAGAVKCWGLNGNGQLGDGTTVNRSTPVTVSGLASGVARVESGHVSTCALTTAGAVKCWGMNTSGQLGDGTLVSKSTPVAVLGLSSGVASVSMAQVHSCALTTAGGVKCWGANTNGQLGDATKVTKSTPVSVSGLTSGVARLGAGMTHSCAVLTTGGLMCWGDNYYGQIGDGTVGTDRTTPVNVSGLSTGVATVSGGDRNTCALLTSGGVKCWGDGYYSGLGDGTTSTVKKSTPVDVTGLASGVVQLTSGSFNSCALTSAGAVKCWGRNQYGQLGDGTQAQRATPVNVSGLTSGVASVNGSLGFTTCAVTTGGAVKCWGYNSYGQLGDGTTNNSYIPVTVAQ